MSRMFTIDGHRMKTWNVIHGCRFNCTYCNARKMAETRLKHSLRYKGGFTPAFVTEELRRHFEPGEWVFICYMGDIFWADPSWIWQVMGAVRAYPQTIFLAMTKAPALYRLWEQSREFMPANLVLGTTIESNRLYQLSKAPSPLSRYLDLWGVNWPRKFVSIEPILDFDLNTLVRWVAHIAPQVVEVGADNYHNHLPEPEWSKVAALLKALRQFVPTVVEKEGLGRLKHDHS